MDWFYLIIFAFALVVFFLDRMHNTEEKKEHFFSEAQFPSKALGVNYEAPSPEPSASMGLTNIKMPGVPKWKSGYSRFGPTPPQLRCAVSVLGENCSNYPNNNESNVYQSVCQKTYNIYPNGTQGFRSPLYVMGRSMSRVNQCNNLYDPPANMVNNNSNLQ